MHDYVPCAGDIVVELPHTLTASTRAPFHARARAELPSASSFSRATPDARLVLDARPCMVIDDAGIAALWILRRTAAAAGVDVLVIDPSPALAVMLTEGRNGTMPLAARGAEVPNDSGLDVPGVLRLDAAARVRLAARRKR